ncbi:MAG: hypothetical protein ABI702_15040 [Burkholderiales bacterium]
MRHRVSRLIVLVPALLASLFHTEVFAQLTATVGDATQVPGYLKVFAGVAVVVLLAARRLR